MQTRFMRRTLLIIVGLTILQALLLVAYAHYEAEVLASESDRLTDRQLYSRARENAERALALNPNHGYARYYLGYLELLQERYPEAINVFQSAIPLMPHLPALLKMLAQGYFFSGDYARATQTLDRYLRMDPAPRAGPDLIFRMWAQALCYSQEFGRASIALAKAEAYQKFRTELLQTRVLNSILLDQIPMADYYYRMFKFFAPTHRMDPGPLFANALAAGNDGCHRRVPQAPGQGPPAQRHAGGNLASLDFLDGGEVGLDFFAVESASHVIGREFGGGVLAAQQAAGQRHAGENAEPVLFGVRKDGLLGPAVQAVVDHLQRPCPDPRGLPRLKLASLAQNRNSQVSNLAGRLFAPEHFPKVVVEERRVRAGVELI